jgi:hypothetical protein
MKTQNKVRSIPELGIQYFVLRAKSRISEQSLIPDFS